LKRVEIHGEHGSARIEQEDITFWNFETPAPEDAALQEAIKHQTGFSAGASDPRGITHEGHRVQLADFLQAIDTGGRPFVDGPQGRKAVEIIRAIYHSARTNQPVRLPYADPGL
jgi:predicted dehydrogenase